MLLRFFVLFYFPLVWIGLGLSQVLGNDVWQGLVFVLGATYVYVRAASKSLTGRVALPERMDPGLLLLFAYVVLYSVLYFPRSSAGIAILGRAPTLLAHVLFWHLAYTSKAYSGDHSRFVRDVIASFTVGFVFAFGNALLTAGVPLTPGSIHDIAYNSPLVRSDLDGPMLALAPVALALGSFRKGIEQRWTILAFVLALLGLWVYSRRGPILVVVLMVGLVLLPRKAHGKAIIALAAAPFLPLLWGQLAPVLVELSKNELVQDLLARNRPEDYVTATGRLSAWVDGFAYLVDFRVGHLIGYGGAPAFLLTREHEHMHNMLLNLFFDAGLITLAMALALIWITFRNLSRLLEHDDSPSTYALYLFFCGWLLLSAIESTLRSFSVAHLVFLVIVVTVLNRVRDASPQDSRSAEAGLHAARAP